MYTASSTIDSSEVLINRSNLLLLLKFNHCGTRLSRFATVVSYQSVRRFHENKNQVLVSHCISRIVNGITSPN